METNNKRPKVVQAPPDGIFSKNITPNKQYEVKGYWGLWDKFNGWPIQIIADNGKLVNCNEKKSYFIGVQDWIIVETE